MTGPGPSRAFSAEMSRDDRRTWFKSRLSEARGRTRETDEELAERVGVSRAQWRRYLDPGSSDSLPAGDLPRLPQEMALFLADCVSVALGARTIAATAEDTHSAGDRVHAVVGEAGSFIFQQQQAARDQVLDAKEAADIEPTVDRLISMLLSIKADCGKARERRSISLERPSRSTDARNTR